MLKRTKARELALQALYQEDLASKTDAAARGLGEYEGFIADSASDPEVREYARSLVDGTLSRKAGIDVRIAQATANWRLQRIAPIDRCILRMALFELLESAEVPPKVVMNEAIELAKKYSTAQSGAFVNGVLDRLYRDLVEELGTGGAKTVER